jgi:membrane protein
MSLKDRKLKHLEVRIRKTHQKELQSQGRWKPVYYRAVRWGEMLYHEVIRDDVAIRAQSLSYFTIFSLMPLMAGIFLLLNFFSQWGPVQNQFQSLLVQILQPIPDDYRDTLMDFILRFKDDYLANLSQKSATIGIFALGVLVWIMAKVFFNVEDTINRIWSSGSNRSWFERIQNFIICAVVVPFCILVAISLPGVISHLSGKEAGFVVEQLLPMLLEFFGMSFLFRYFPNVRVLWRSAFWGAGFSAVLLLIANSVLKIYFRFGTETAYGKAGVLPIIAFFIYVFWMIFILGVEVSYMIQNRSLFIGKHLPSTTLGEAAVLEAILKLLDERFTSAKPPLSADKIAIQLNVPFGAVAKTLRYLRRREVVVEALGKKSSAPSTYVLARALETFDLRDLIKDYLDIDVLAQNFDGSLTIEAFKPK